MARRLERAENGNFGDHKSVGGSVSEMRIPVGPGYRLYYMIRNRDLIFLLCGGDKSSQKQDIERAKAMAKEIEQ